MDFEAILELDDPYGAPVHYAMAWANVAWVDAHNFLTAYWAWTPRAGDGMLVRTRVCSIIRPVEGLSSAGALSRTLMGAKRPGRQMNRLHA